MFGGTQNHLKAALRNQSGFLLPLRTRQAGRDIRRLNSAAHTKIGPQNSAANGRNAAYTSAKVRVAGEDENSPAADSTKNGAWLIGWSRRVVGQRNEF
jgi:hypothetical protein